MEKKAEAKDQNNKLDKKESQSTVNNKIEDSYTNEEKQTKTNSIKTQDVPCNIKGVLVHVQQLIVIDVNYMNIKMVLLSATSDNKRFLLFFIQKKISS